MATITQTAGSIFNTVVKVADTATLSVDALNSVVTAWHDNANLYKVETQKNNKIALKKLDKKLAREAALADFKARKEIENMMTDEADAELFNSLLAEYTEILEK
jgi:ribosomal protein S21